MEGVGATVKKAHNLSKPMLIYAFTVVTVVLGELHFCTFCYSNYFFPIHDSVPKAQKSQRQGLANEFFLLYMVALRPSCFVRVCVRACPRALSPTFLTCLRKVILRHILN